MEYYQFSEDLSELPREESHFPCLTTSLSKLISLFVQVVDGDARISEKGRLCTLSLGHNHLCLLGHILIFLKPGTHGENVLADKIEKGICWWGQ